MHRVEHDPTQDQLRYRPFTPCTDGPSNPSATFLLNAPASNARSKVAAIFGRLTVEFEFHLLRRQTPVFSDLVVVLMSSGFYPLFNPVQPASYACHHRSLAQ